MSKCPIVALVRNKAHLNPIDMYLITRNIVSYRLSDEHDEVDGERTYDKHSMISNLLKEVADCSYLHKVIKSGLRNDLMEVLLAFKWLCLF